MTSLPLPRSFLYVPGDRPDMYGKAAASGADAVILDLEDAVAPTAKVQAQTEVRTWLADQQPNTDVQWWVRIAPERMAEDLPAVLCAALAGIIVAKVDADALNAVEVHLRDADGPAVIGLVETAATHTGLSALLAHPRLTTLGIGEVDLLADLGITESDRTRGVIDALRLEVVRQCAAAGSLPPIAPTSTRFRELVAFRESSDLFRDLGFGGRTAIHPAQIPVIHEVFTPTASEVAAAQDILDRLERGGGGVALDADGHLIDAAVIRKARLVLDRAR